MINQSQIILRHSYQPEEKKWGTGGGRRKTPTNHSRDIIVQDLTAKATYNSRHCRNACCWQEDRHGGGL